MASEFPKQKILVRDLTTKSVTLYPSRAHITRDINDVILKPGTNEIEIIGLTPSIDENSVQIDGKGDATIIDMTVDLVPNSEIFEEIYPEEDDELDTESDVSFEDSDDETETVQALSSDIKSIRNELADAIQRQGSANQRLAALEQYMKAIKPDKVEASSAKKILDQYAEESSTLFEQHTKATKDAEECRKRLARKENERLNAGKDARRQKLLEQRKKDKAKRKTDLQKAEKKKAAHHLKQERLTYWPKKVYKVTLLLETTSIDTPDSSRRNSIDSITLAKSPTSEDVKTISSTKSDTLVSLSLSYVTRDATWTPRYDLKINSVNKTALIVYRTEFVNNTSETWKDAKVSFSTSQTSYQGLDDVVPYLLPWNVRTGRNYDAEPGLFSSAELNKSQYKSKKTVQNATNRSSLYSGDAWKVQPYVEGQSLFTRQKHMQNRAEQNGSVFSKQSNAGGLFGSAQQLQQQAQQAQQPAEAARTYGSHTNAIYQSVHSAPFGSSGAGFGAQSAVPAAAPPPPPGRGQTSLFGSTDRRVRLGRGGSPAPEKEEIEDLVAQEIPDANSLEFEESTWEDSGLTATYDIPGTRTLPPSSQIRRHKIATLNAKNIFMSHISVPKLRAAAFLRVKIRNPSSSVTLIKGSAGVTLDGSFIGNMTLPRVAPSQLFDLPLGVDPSIHITYPKPSVRRSTQGLFGKESAHVFSRSIWVNNTKTAPVELLLLDQIPVSQEEKLRIDILAPKGLRGEGDSVRTGISAKEAVASTAGQGAQGSQASAGAKNWGSAVATLKKNGEVAYTVKLEKGQGCYLKLDYEARLPTNEQIIQA